MSKKEKILEVINSDKFLDLPVSTQTLYFHICARADEKGYLHNPKTLLRAINAKQCDFDTLVQKNFILYNYGANTGVQISVLMNELFGGK